MFIKKAMSTLLLYECVFLVEWKEEKDSVLCCHVKAWRGMLDSMRIEARASMSPSRTLRLKAE